MHSYIHTRKDGTARVAKRPGNSKWQVHVGHSSRSYTYACTHTHTTCTRFRRKVKVVTPLYVCIYIYNIHTFPNGRHVWVKVVSAPDLEVLPLSMRVDERYLRYPSLCTSEGSICTNTPGSHTCACKVGFVLSGTDCIKEGASGSFATVTEGASTPRVFDACPPGALSRPDAKAKADCYCPAGHYRNNSHMGLPIEDEACVPCPAGTCMYVCMYVQI
jgi:hypothetical protein